MKNPDLPSCQEHHHGCWEAALGPSHSFVSSRLTKLVPSLCPQKEDAPAPTQPRVNSIQFAHVVLCSVSR